MTRPELHALVDIVMDAREKGRRLEIRIDSDVEVIGWYNSSNGYDHFFSFDYPAFSDFTQAVKEYIKTLETK